MTRKDFELLANVVKAHRLYSGNDTVDQLARDMADALKATNTQFNRDKFIRACGGQP
jgi:ribonuclease HI